MATLYPPIAAATIINVLLFALAWRGTQLERATGKEPWWLGLGICLYTALLGGYMYFTRGQPLSGYIDYFVTALLGEAAGVLIVYAILHTFVFTRGQPKADRAFAFIATVFLTGLMFAGVFVT